MNPVAKGKESSLALEAVDNAVQVTVPMRGREHFSCLQGGACRIWLVGRPSHESVMSGVMGGVRKKIGLCHPTPVANSSDK